MRWCPLLHPLIWLNAAWLISGCATLATHLDLNADQLQTALATPVPPQAQATAKAYDESILQQVPVWHNSAQQARIETLVRNIIAVSHKKDLQPVVRLLDSDDLNAFVTGGNYVYVYRGLIESVGSDDELAGILAHELAHLDAGHVSRSQRTQLWTQLGLLAAGAVAKGETAEEVIRAAGALIQPMYSREHEREADVLGAVYAHRAGYDADRFTDFFKRTGQEEARQRQIAEQYLRRVYDDEQQACQNYLHYEQLLQQTADPSVQAQAAQARNACAEAQQQFAVAKNQYQQFVAQLSPLLRSHPMDSERIGIIRSVAEYLNGLRDLETLANYPAAIKVLSTLEVVDARAAARPHFEKALAAQQSGQTDAAIAAYQQAISLDPSYTEAYLNLAGLYAEVRRTEEAIALYDKALTLAPNNPSAQERLGNLYLQTGRSDLAIPPLERSAKLKNPATHATLGR